MVLHAALSSEDVVVVAAVTVGSILMIYVHSKNDECADTEIVFLYLGKWHY